METNIIIQDRICFFPSEGRIEELLVPEKARTQPHTWREQQFESGSSIQRHPSTVYCQGSFTDRYEP